MTITTKIWVLVGVTIGLGMLRWIILRQIEHFENKIVRISVNKLKDPTIHPNKGYLEMKVLELYRMVYSITKVGMYIFIGIIFAQIMKVFESMDRVVMVGGLITIIFIGVEINQYTQKRKRIIQIGKKSTLEDIECLKRRNLTYLPIKSVIEYKGIIPWLVIIPNLLELPSIGKMYMRNFEEPSEEYLKYLFQREPEIAKWSISVRNIGLVIMWLIALGYLFVL
ncbi:MAG: hypothetical protein ACRC1P_09225 [Cellulosilyticaceae bacterium]